MTNRIVLTRGTAARRSFAATIVAALFVTSAAFAQQPQQSTPAQRPAQQSKPAAKPAQKPAAQPQQPAQQQQPAQAPNQEQVQLIYSPWTKFCLKGKEQNAKQVCFTGKDARIESGMPVVAAVLIEPEGDPKKMLRVTLPLGMQLQFGTRVIIDQAQPLTGPYVICFSNGCMSDYQVDADMIGKLKKGQSLVVQAVNSTGQPITLPLPLVEFAKAYDGPPTDPKVFEEQQKKLQEGLQKRAGDALKNLENQQQAQPPSQPPAR